MLDGLRWDAGSWELVEDQLCTAGESTAALCTTSNGYLGARAHGREPFGDSLVLLAGVHEQRPYAHPERSFGAPDHYQTIVAVTDPWRIAILVDGRRVTPESATWQEHERRLDLRTGCVATHGTWCTAPDRGARIRSRRLVSLEHPGLVWHELAVEPMGPPVEVEVVAEVRANTTSRTFPGEPDALTRAYGRIFQPVEHRVEGDRAGLVHATTLSARAVACATATFGAEPAAPVTASADTIRRRWRAVAGPGQPLMVGQRSWFGDGPLRAGTDLLEGCFDGLDRVADGLDAAVEDNRAVLDQYWDVARVDLDGQPDLAGEVRFAAFQVLQATLLNGSRGVSAKALSGQGYEGHHLWEAEVFVSQALSLLAPAAARDLLGFRCRTLPQARARAAELSHRGAQYPWRTIDGSEASAFFPAGAAQHHLNADIAWAIDHHVTCTGDDQLLDEGGRSVVVETARLWLSLGRFDDDGRFHIDGVTGPDEYTALVDDNLFTNLMAARNLRSAAAHVTGLAARGGARFDELRADTGVGPEEPGEWLAAAEAIELPYDESLGVHGQDAGFLRRPRWDVAGTPPEERPLQDHHHLLALYRFQVLKQADVLHAVALLPDAFTPEEAGRAFDHYEPLTTHDSSLSAPVHAVVAARTGRMDAAWRYFVSAAGADLACGHPDTLPDGLHLASAAGTWLAVATGFGGFAPATDTPSFCPRLPAGVRRLRFAVRFRGSAIEVVTASTGTTYRLLDGPPCTLLHHGRTIELDGTARGEPAGD